MSFLSNLLNKDKEYRKIKKSGLFDENYYKNQYPGNKKFNTTPLGHYLNVGWKEGKNPNPAFYSRDYLDRNPDVKKADVNPLLHYVFNGVREGRSPNRFFDPIFYKKKYIKKRASRINGFLHYARKGCRRHHRPNALFDSRFYSDNYPEYVKTDAFPLPHYYKTGVFKGLYPCREVADLPNKPIISIVCPVYNTSKSLLQQCIQSVLYQAYPHWELCLTDDGSTDMHVKSIITEYVHSDKRIKVRFLNENQGISGASNAGAALATGEYIGFLDHDDELPLNALYEVVLAINEYDPDILYTDEDLVDYATRHLDNFFKPDYNAELLLSHNYITHFMVTRRDLFESVGRFSKECDGAQDYDLMLKLVERSNNIHHIEEILYHWRADKESTSINHTNKDYADAAGKKALESALIRRKIEAEVKPGRFTYYYTVEKKLTEHPLVSIIAVVRDTDSVQETWITQMVYSNTYPNIEFIILFSGKSNEKILKQIEKIDNHRISADQFKEDLPTSIVLNHAVERSGGKHLAFIGQNIVPLMGNWVEILLGHSQESGNGVVGGLVRYSESDEKPLNALPDLENNSWQYFCAYFQTASRHLNGLFCPQHVLAVSTELCMVKRVLFDAAGGFDATDMKHVMFDSDLCLRLREQGVENVFTPACEAECNLRVTPAVSDDIAINELALFKKRWNKRLKDGDPYYNVKRILHDKGISHDEWIKWYTGVSTVIN